MTTTSERKFVNLRKRLDQLGYRQPLGIDTLPLVEKLFSDLVHTTESLRNAKLLSGKTEKESRNLDSVLEPYRTENARLVQENNKLHQELLRLKEESDQQIKDLKYTIRKLEHDTADLKFLNNQYVHKVRSLEKESKAKTEKIQQLQEKNLQAVVQTPGGKRRTIPFRRQRMQIDQSIPPSGIASAPQIHTEDPYYLDLLNVADDRIMGLQDAVNNLKAELDKSDRGMRKFQRQVDARDEEIERLNRSLEGGRPHDVISLEAKNKSNERLIAHLNLQVEYLQRTNCDLEKQMKELLEKKSEATNEVVNLSTKNEHLCNELNEIDHLAQQLERDKEIALEIADKEIKEAKDEIQKQHRELEGFEETIARLTRELTATHNTHAKIQDDLQCKTKENQTLHDLFNQLKKEKQRLHERVDEQVATEREIVVELERMRAQHGILRGDTSPSRLDKFIKTLEEERDYYKFEVEYLQDLVSGRNSPICSPRRGRSPTRITPVKSSSLSSELLQVIRERDELQSVLDKFEQHMAEIQSNVKVLTSERDKLLMMYEQNQDELNKLKKEVLISPICKMRVEDEREEAKAELKRMTAERDGLRERVKAILETADLNTKQMEQQISHLENKVCELDNKCFAFKKKVTTQMEDIATLEEKTKFQSQKLLQSNDDASHLKAELSSFRLQNEHLEKSLADMQHRLAMKSKELQTFQDRIGRHEERLGEFSRQISVQQEEVSLLKSTISALDQEKDCLQEAMDDKTEKIATLEDNLANREKALNNMKITVTELESALDLLNDTLSNRDREINSLRRQHDSIRKELEQVKQSRDNGYKENRCLQDDLAQMTRENQAINSELDQALHEKDDLKSRVHNYINEVARIESLMVAKEQELHHMLEQYRLATNQAENWEHKAHQAEGESNSIRLELLSIDTERRHHEERVIKLEREIQEHISAQQAYEKEITYSAKSMSKLEEELRQTQAEKCRMLGDCSSIRELCAQLDSNKDSLSRQLTTRNMEHERTLSELEDSKSENELLKKQLNSERVTIKNLETLLTSTREKELQCHLNKHEIESEIQLLGDKLSLAESKVSNQNRELIQLRTKSSQLQSELDLIKRQLTTERFERERAIQEMRHHGLSTTATSLSPLRTSMSPLCRSQDACSPKGVSECSTDC
ncbi:centrosomal protein of 135 kDa isoform X1 [Amblyraja radiata]|uniref:centrosomal protein of 135 kDa isoform X1 n=1 Tax=Amblyraja radiata TaxID=386614 RepID=UPI00140369A2|nr:centrosomal protein of 135 kDa isoform X1 [Amblyraja radiata]XP_032884923.1 centrosomal protein of 135 kDa isoform X1 [Amblyraja radiata]XP_032884968.1 centrosomal protein of 135 kDa isoform X1 [Amblyraja radiata]